MEVDLLSAAIRALSFIALFQAAGAAIFIALIPSPVTEPVRRLGLYTAFAAILLVSLHYALEAARMAGEISGIADISLQRLVLDSSLFEAFELRIIGLVALALGLWLTGRWALLLSLAGALTVLAAFLVVGHTATPPLRYWLSGALLAHLVVVAFWFGSLLPLVLVTRSVASAQAAQIVESFSRVAVISVPLIFIAGLIMTLALVDRWSVFTESYGLILLFKVGVFAALMALATLNRWRFGPALASEPRALPAFQRTVITEYGLICLVLIATAVMTTLYSPES